MYLTIVFLPLIAALAAGLLGKKIGPYGATRITSLCMTIVCILSYISFFDVALLHNPVYIRLFYWANLGVFDLSWGFMFDSLTVFMLVVVSTVSMVVHLYSIGYMESDPHIARFFSYLSTFTFFMLILITADNFVQMFVGWEGVGLCSYLLINFWHNRLQANKAAIKAVIINRLGDLGLLLGMLGLFHTFKTLNYTTIFALVPVYSSGAVGPTTLWLLCFEIEVLTFICVSLFIGAVGKSAQLGLHSWLPDAMEGPTPVSALIHAATMVTAGVFLIARCSPLFEYSPSALGIVTCFGALTAFFGATTAAAQEDLKKVIAYSTCSQLGYMIFACGTSNYSIGLFHLGNHAFFKALLFLSAGSVIHALGDEQDMRNMGGLARLLPFTYIMMGIGSASLMGYPFLTGFYSKDAILEISSGQFTFGSRLSFWLGSVSATFTSYYSSKVVYKTFLSGSSSESPKWWDTGVTRDMPKTMGYPLFILAFGSIFIGALTKDMLIGAGTNFWGNSLFVSPENNRSSFDVEFLSFWIKCVPFVFSGIGSFSASVLHGWMCSAKTQRRMQARLDLLRECLSFSNKKWLIDKFHNEFINLWALEISYHKTYKGLDRGVVENIGPFGLSKLFYIHPIRLNFLQTGLIYHAAFSMLLGIILLFTGIGLFLELREHAHLFLIYGTYSLVPYFVSILIVSVFFVIYVEKKPAFKKKV